MLKSLKNLPQEEAEQLLAYIAQEYLPTPDEEPQGVTVQQEPLNTVLNEIRVRAKVTSSDASRVAKAKLLRVVTEELEALAIPPKLEAEAKARLGARGELSLGSYGIEFAGKQIHEVEAYGIRRSHILESATRAERVQHFQTNPEAGSYRPFSVWEQGKNSQDPFTLLVLASRSGSTLFVDFAARIYHSDVDIRGSKSPIESLRAFVNVFGLPVTLYGRPPILFGCDEVFPISPQFAFGPPVIKVQSHPNQEFSLRANIATVSELSVAKVGFVFSIDVLKYFRSLKSHGVATSKVTFRTVKE